MVFIVALLIDILFLSNKHELMSGKNFSIGIANYESSVTKCLHWAIDRIVRSGNNSHVGLHNDH